MVCSFVIINAYPKRTITCMTMFIAVKYMTHFYEDLYFINLWLKILKIAIYIYIYRYIGRS